MSSFRPVEVLLLPPPHAATRAATNVNSTGQAPSRLPGILNALPPIEFLRVSMARSVPRVDVGAPIALAPIRRSAPPPRTSEARLRLPLAVGGSCSPTGRRRDAAAQGSGRARSARGSALRIEAG